MKKIAIKLMECGYSFEYQNNNSNGELIQVLDTYFKVDSQQGQIFIDYQGYTETHEETPETYDYICGIVEQMMIDETSSF